MRLSLCMIVRDEAEALPRCLSSVQGVVDEIVVVDTGSTDGTPEIAMALGARVEHRPWTHDFAAARNESLALAQGEWILVLDADEELTDAARAALPALLDDATVDGYLVQIANMVGNEGNPSTETGVNLRLFRNRPGYRFRGRLHEQVAEAIRQANPSARLVDGRLQIRHWGYLDRVVAAKSKSVRNLVLAREWVEAAPDDAFARFNLGIELQRQGDCAGAVREFERSHALHTPGTYWGSKLIKSYTLALIHLERHTDALALLAAEIPRYGEFTDLYFLQGTCLSAQTQHSEALHSFERCLALGPAPVPPYSGVEPALGACKAHFACGEALSALGRMPEALAAYQQAFAGQPSWLEPLRRMGALLLRTQGVEGARAGLAQLLGAGPDLVVVLADVLQQQKRYDAGFEVLESIDAELAAAEPATREAALYLRSRCLLKLGRYGEAIATAGRIPVGSPHWRPALVNHVFCLWSEEREPEARKLMRRHRLGADFRNEVADLFLEEAEEVLVEGLQHFPEATLLQEALAQVQREQRTS